MTENPDHTRRWLINVSGAALLSNVLPVAPASAQGAGAANQAAAEGSRRGRRQGGAALAGHGGARRATSPARSTASCRPPVVAKTKMHVLDTIAAMVSGSRLKAGVAAARYVRGRWAASRRRPWWAPAS